MIESKRQISLKILGYATPWASYAYLIIRQSIINGENQCIFQLQRRMTSYLMTKFYLAIDFKYFAI